MDSHTENTKRIAKNTLMLYSRMLFSMVVSLYTSRVVLNTLGVEDYGIQNVVGGFVTMFSIISSSLSSSVSRFLTFELGKGDINRLKRVFSTSMIIHIGLVIIVVIAAETIGIWFVNHKMVIPPERMCAANWVFQASVATFCFGLLSTPYNASIISHEHMGAFAYIGILEVCLKLGIILFVAHSPWNFDRLIVYSLLLLAVSISIRYAYWMYCRKHFEECRIQLSYDKQYFKEMGAFAGWNFIGCTAGLLKDQGINILLNLFYGPIVNAARGIAVIVSNSVSGFANNFMTALNPQITKSYAAGEKDYTMSLVERGSRFSFYVIFIFALPLCLETEFILNLWLKEYPNHTINFVRLILILSLSDILSNTLINLQSATGKIRDYQIVVGGTLMLNFPLSYFALKMNLPPESTLAIAIIISVCCMILRLLFLRKMAGLSVRSFIIHVYTNVLSVVILSSIIPFVIHNMIPIGWERFIITCATSLLCSSIVILFIGCNRNERSFIFSKISIFRKH
ncbi:MAG: lipopolysaccharide biosynthesis protein [Bacteroidaceae bacterium]|nr:lipopolysaccharide biosynthesis protein [Bacteroidaceae bacterium]